MASKISWFTKLLCIWYHWKAPWKCKIMVIVSCLYLDNFLSFSSFNGWMDGWMSWKKIWFTDLAHLTQCAVIFNILHNPAMSEHGLQNRSHFEKINTQIMAQTMECELHSKYIYKLRSSNTTIDNELLEDWIAGQILIIFIFYTQLWRCSLTIWCNSPDRIATGHLASENFISIHSPCC